MIPNPIPPLAQLFGLTALCFAILAWPLLACVALGGAFLLVVLAAGGPKLP